MSGTFLSAEWRHLLMLNYETDPAILTSLVPRGTSLDLWEGAAYVSVVGFRFLHTRLFGVPIPYHRDFEEVNLRFYVRRQSEDGELRRGVVFVRELVPRPAIALVARLTYNEPYRALPMRSTVPASAGTGGRLAYEWKIEPDWEGFGATSDGALARPAGGSAAEFITEHYWGYTRQRDGGTIEYQVEHPPWRVGDATDAHLRVDVARLYGAPFVATLSVPPASAFVAEGSPILVSRPRRIA